MIDKSAFAEGMGQLGGAFGRVIDGPVTKMYYGILSPKLSTEEWAEAVKRTMETERYWPSPAVILATVKDGPEETAAAAFSVVRRELGKYGQMRDVGMDIYEHFDEPTKTALKIVGGLREVWEGKVSEKRWARAYSAGVTPRNALPPGGTMDPKARRLIDGTATKLQLVSGRDRAAGKDA